jgi:hypothetical protein
MGRVLRPAPGKKSSRVITIFATKQELLRLQNEQSKYQNIINVKWFEIINGKNSNRW